MNKYTLSDLYETVDASDIGSVLLETGLSQDETSAMVDKIQTDRAQKMVNMAIQEISRRAILKSIEIDELETALKSGRIELMGIKKVLEGLLEHTANSLEITGDTLLADLNLETALVNALAQNDIFSVYDLSMTPIDMVMNIRTVGTKRLVAIMDIMQKANLQFLESSEEVPVAYAFRDLVIKGYYYQDGDNKEDYSDEAYRGYYNQDEDNKAKISKELINAQEFIKLLELAGVKKLGDINIDALKLVISGYPNNWNINQDESYIYSIDRSYDNESKSYVTTPHLVTGNEIVEKLVFEAVNKILYRYFLKVL